MRRVQRSAFVAAAILTATVALAPVSAMAAEAPDLQVRIDSIVAEYGGAQTAWNEVSWEDDQVVLTLAEGVDAARTAPMSSGCASGRYCAYSGIGYTGDKITYSTCPATHTAFVAIGSVRSIMNARSSGTVRAYGGATLKAALSPSVGRTSISGVAKITCTL